MVISTLKPALNLFLSRRWKLLEEWRRWEDEPEPTLENTSVYVTEPDGIQYFYCGNTRIRVSEHFSQAGKPMDKLIENVVQYAARNAG